jgi:hypothetical protein
MDLDALLFEYFGTSNLAEAPPAARLAGNGPILVDLGLERQRSKRFALGGQLHMLGAAPELDVAFRDEVDRDASRNFVDPARRGRRRRGQRGLNIKSVAISLRASGRRRLGTFVFSQSRQVSRNDCSSRVKEILTVWSCWR